MSNLKDLAIAFVAVVKGVATKIYEMDIRNVPDKKLLKELAHFVHFDYHYGTHDVAYLAKEIERRLLKDPSNTTLRPYGEAINALAPNLRDNGYSLKGAFSELTAPIYATFATPLERALSPK